MTLLIWQMGYTMSGLPCWFLPAGATIRSGYYADNYVVYVHCGEWVCWGYGYSDWDTAAADASLAVGLAHIVAALLPWLSLTVRQADSDAALL